MSLLDEHKGSMEDGAYLALSNGLKTAHEAEEHLVEVSYVKLDSHVDSAEQEAVVRGTVYKMIAEEAGVHESTSSLSTGSRRVPAYAIGAWFTLKWTLKSSSSNGKMSRSFAHNFLSSSTV